MKGQETMNLSNWYEAEGLGGNQLFKARQSIQNWLHLFAFPAIYIIDNLKASASQLLLQPIKILTITLDMLHLQMMLL
jgi:hypothetical protein